MSLPKLLCPEGHNCKIKMPGAKGFCTPLYCALLPPKIGNKKKFEELNDQVAVGRRVPEKDKVPAGDTHDRESEEFDVEKERKRQKKLNERTRLRHEAVGFVQPPSGQEEEYVNRKKQALTPAAMAELEWKLFNGNDMARDSAARFILEAGGHGKQEGKNFGAAPVLIVAAGELPWAQTTLKEAQKVVDAAPVRKAPAGQNALLLEEGET